MPRDLDAFSAIVSGDVSGLDPRPDRDELSRALQILLYRQCIYAGTQQIGRAYQIVRAYEEFFSAYFACMNYQLVVSSRYQMIALQPVLGEPRYDAQFSRMRREEALFLLVLKILRDEAFAENRFGENGVAEVTTDEVVDRWRALDPQAKVPEESRMMDIAKEFQRRGIVSIGQRDRSERVTPISVLPGIDMVATDTFVDHLRHWAQAAAEEDGRPVPARREADAHV